MINKRPRDLEIWRNRMVMKREISKTRRIWKMWRKSKER